MNTQLSTVLNDHADVLRELSHAEQIQASGGRTCYVFPSGSNPTRYRSANGSIFFERWNSSQRRYVVVNSFDGEVLGTQGLPFTNFCKARGYNFIKD